MNASGKARWLVAVLLALLAGCGGGNDSAVSIVSARVDDHGPIFRQLVVTLSEPASVEVEYWASTGPRLLVRSHVGRALAHQLPLARLRALESYQYRVRVLDDVGRPVSASEGTFATADLPDDLRSITFTPSGQASYPLSFLSVRSSFTGGLVVDSQGHVVWYARTPGPPFGAARRGNGDWVILIAGVGLMSYTPLGVLAASLTQDQVPGIETIHHDLTITPRDKALFLTFEPRNFAGQVLRGEALWEWDPTANTLHKRWSAFDFLDPAVDIGPRSVPNDWFHANSVALGPRGNVILSLHHLDQVLSLAPDFGSIEWRLGGAGSTLSVGVDQATSGQHSAREVGPNRILIFDNGYERADGGRYSRAIELELDLATASTRTVWEYRPSPDIWSTVISSVRRLDNGNSVVTFGAPPGQRGATGPVALHEVSPTGQLLWSLGVSLPGGGVFQGDPMNSIAGEVVVP
jgi:hypothetical protein